MSPRALPFPPQPRGAPRRPTAWPRAREAQARWRWRGDPLRPGPAPSVYLRLPSEAAAAAAAAAEVEAVGLGAQARCGSYPRRSTRMEKAGEDAQGHFVTTLLVTRRGRQGQAPGNKLTGQ